MTTDSYIERSGQKYLREAAGAYRVLTVTGPRQSGKTSLAKHLFPNHRYVTLEAPDELLAAKEDPRSFLRHGQEPMILDEVQRCPELLSYIQGYVDERQIKAHFVLTGSAQFQLMASISQSLAGRTAFLSLLPLSLEEILNWQENFSTRKPEEWILAGGYPGTYVNHTNTYDFYRNYVQSFVEKDVRQLVAISSLADFQKFLKLLAGRVGQILNQSSLATEVGVSQPTIKSWLNVLEASYIVFRLQPYFENFGKRLVKNSKIYFTDVGLASYLLGIENIQQLERDPLRGNLFENLVVLEILKKQWNQGRDQRCYFYRDNHGNEVDLILQHGRHLCPLEIKMSASYQPTMIRSLDYFKELIGIRCINPTLVYAGEGSKKINAIDLMNFQDISSHPLLSFQTA